jgi:hypothetical protein
VTIQEAIDQLGPTRETAFAKLREMGIRDCVVPFHGRRSRACIIHGYLTAQGVAKYIVVSRVGVNTSGGYDKEFKTLVDGTFTPFPEHIGRIVDDADVNNLPADLVAPR